MACNITAGFTYDCADSQGGIDAIFMTNGPVESFTEAAGEITAITVGGSALVPADWFKFETPRQTSSITETITPSQENGTVTYQQDITMIFNKMTAAKRNEILLMAQNQELIVVAKDNNGLFFSIGIERGAYMTAGTSVSGVAYADRNGYELTITGMEKDPMYTVLSSIIEA
jgi:hypothetical protein|tara:strand:- start:667 stop:1182 length:516 start_codon:yes stop_codon:yes gene_type:complete